MDILLQKELGQPLTTKQVSAYLNVDIATVRKYYKTLGGVKFGSCYRFFERRLIDAVLRQEQEQMDGPGESRRAEVQETIRHQKRSQKVGIKPQKRASKDTHNLLT